MMAGLFLTGAASAAPSAKLWPLWTRHDATSTATIDNRAWDAFLKKYVRPGRGGVNLVAYGRVTGADKRALLDYLSRLSATRISAYSRREQRAYWINLYNALTVKVMLDHWPVKTIRDIGISPGLFARGPWGKKLVTVEGTQVSLDDIEHRILRPIWRDPRIHYAVNCASIGCPNLMATAFTATNADALLNKGARDYVNSPRGVRVENGRVIASSIYTWFQSDFGGSEAGVLSHLKKYAEPALKAQLDQVRDIDDYEYDWAPNAAG